MKRNMRQWIEKLKSTGTKKPIPVLSFPCVSLLGITVRELISDSELQARGMKAVADRTDAAASVSFMDLSVEAECFGAKVVVSDDEVPTVNGRLINGMDEAEALEIPAIGSGRTQIYIDALKNACEVITDRPVLAGMIGTMLADRKRDGDFSYLVAAVAYIHGLCGDSAAQKCGEYSLMASDLIDQIADAIKQ